MVLIEADEAYDLWKCYVDEPLNGCGRKFFTLPFEEL